MDRNWLQKKFRVKNNFWPEDSDSEALKEREGRSMVILRMVLY